ncbi:MAG: DUF1707 SHOCT-like domain-containing protein, partial [Streptosporangiaceae bacterium]
AWLAGSADRERPVGVLRAAFTEGRLSQDELDDRVARAYAARTYGDLWALIADLPTGPLPYPGGLPYQQATPAVPSSAEPDTSWHSAAALVITALVIFALAALVTAIATAHAQPLPFQQGSHQPAQTQPFQRAQLAPFITTEGGQALGHAPTPVRP